jgi:hypothetical protein
MFIKCSSPAIESVVQFICAINGIRQVTELRTRVEQESVCHCPAKSAPTLGDWGPDVLMRTMQQHRHVGRKCCATGIQSPTAPTYAVVSTRPDKRSCTGTKEKRR